VIKILTSKITVYIIGILASIVASKMMGVDWLPSDKFSFEPSAVFPSPVITAGIIAGVSTFFTFDHIFTFYIGSAVGGTVVGVLFTRYLDLILPRQENGG